MIRMRNDQNDEMMTVEKSMKAAKELVSNESESHASKVWN